MAVAIDNCEEDQQQKQQQQPPKSEKVEEKVLPKITRNTKIERIEPRINLEKMINSSLEKAKALPRVDKQKLESPKVNRSDKPVKQVKPVTKEVKAGSKEDDTRSRSTEVKSEISDQEGSMVSAIQYSTVYCVGLVHDGILGFDYTLTPAMKVYCIIMCTYTRTLPPD